MTERERLTKELERWRSVLKDQRRASETAAAAWLQIGELGDKATLTVDALTAELAALPPDEQKPPPEPKLPPPVLGHSYRIKHKSRDVGGWMELPYKLAQVGPHEVILRTEKHNGGWSGRHNVADSAAITETEWRNILGQYCAAVEDVTPAPKPCPREVGRRYKIKGKLSGEWAEAILALDRDGEARMFITDSGDSSFGVGFLSWGTPLTGGQITGEAWKSITGGCECEALDA